MEALSYSGTALVVVDVDYLWKPDRGYNIPTKPNRRNHPNKKGQADPISKPLMVYRPTGRLLAGPMPIPYRPKINQKAPAMGAPSTTIPKPFPSPISNSFGALQDPECEGPVGDNAMVQKTSKGVESQVISPHRTLENVSIRSDGCLPPEHGIEAHTNLAMEHSVDRDSIHGSPSSDNAVSYQERGNPLNPPRIDTQQTNPSNLANVGINNLAYRQDDVMLAPPLWGMADVFAKLRWY
ncbi:hypothetical protein Nepgr_003907 [Nepenthes gracilis]|uniref:Uncharacterized protein n=1 Tax=Nepenthes gracilis TaxID=150966 RepID=A0AAD3XED3_NEPGR|nr:hypothetical protein Nepgr_003907 [Nepenthes gracilis]